MIICNNEISNDGNSNIDVTSSTTNEELPSSSCIITKTTTATRTASATTTMTPRNATTIATTTATPSSYSTAARKGTQKQQLRFLAGVVMLLVATQFAISTISNSSQPVVVTADHRQQQQQQQRMNNNHHDNRQDPMKWLRSSSSYSSSRNNGDSNNRLNNIIIDKHKNKFIIDNRIINDDEHQNDNFHDNRIKRRRKLQQKQQQKCPPEPHSSSSSFINKQPSKPAIPILKHATHYAASFPGTNDKLLTKTLIESLTGCFVGEASSSPSLEKRMELLAKSNHDGGGNDNGNNGDGNDNDSNTIIKGGIRGQGEVIALRTHYPHTSDKLASWDDDVGRAFVILRNPLHAIASYFNEVYEMNNHLPAGTSISKEHAQSAQDAWITWRDHQLRSQILLYRRFVSFWMEKYEGQEDARKFFSYEEMVDETKGPLEAIRLANFLGEGLGKNAAEMAMHTVTSMEGGGEKVDQGVIDLFVEEALQTMVKIEDVPCVWEEIVYSKQKTPTSLIQMNRPFTPENLMSISQMLLELMNRWNRHQRVLNIMAEYHRQVNRMYLQDTGQLEDAQKETDALIANSSSRIVTLEEEEKEEKLITSPPKTFRIFQVSPPVETRSAIATNWLMGLFEPDADFAFMVNSPEFPIHRSNQQITIDKTVVTKTHNMELLYLYKKFRPLFDEIFFVVSNRRAIPNSSIGAEVCEYKNVLCLDFDEMGYTSRQEMQAMVQAITEKFRLRFGFFFGDDAEWKFETRALNAIERLDAMERARESIANEPVDKVDLKFGIYGGHGNKVVAGDAMAVEATDVEDGDAGNRRRLSIALPDGGCEITWPIKPKGRIQTAYAASYPGCGARMTWNLVEALTGLWTGDDWDNNHRGKDVVTVKTHYPHHAGHLVPWDDEIKRALVIIRNPMHAIPSLFNHIYEIKNHLPVHSERAPVDKWIEWRDEFAENQILKYGKFVNYWMERFDKWNKDRIIFSYEGLVGDDTGPEEAIRLAQFLSESEGVETIAKESVPCVWKAVVKFQDKTPNSKQRRLDDGRRRLDPMHHDTRRSGPTERPYTIKHLEVMSQMLLDLIKKWGNRHSRLNVILESYQLDVNKALLAARAQPQQINASGDAPPLALFTNNGADGETAVPTVSKRLFHIIQVSLPHDFGSIVLTNLLMGLFEPDADISLIEDWPELPVRQQGLMIPIEQTIVSKTNCIDVIRMYKKFRPMFEEVFFVISNKGTDPSARISSELCEYTNVLCVEHEELLYTNRQEIETIVHNIANKFHSTFDYFFADSPQYFDETTKVNAVNRLEAMSTAAVRIADQPFDVTDRKFGVHGGLGSTNDTGEIAKVENKIATQETTVATQQTSGFQKSFHIFQASPPKTASVVATNWLMGMFEPEEYFSFMINTKGRPVRHRGEEVPVDTTIVTKTNYVDLMALYKRFRNDFDEVFFVVTTRGTSDETRIDPIFCEYTNVLCIEYEDLLYSNRQDMEVMVKKLTARFQNRFEYFFGANSSFFGQDRQINAVRRLEEMDKVTASLSSQPPSVLDRKFGVRGGHRSSNLLEAPGAEANSLALHQTANHFDKSFHIFQASPPHTASTVVTNWLMGIFEPSKNYSFMVNIKGRPIMNNGIEVPVDSTIVTKTHYLDLMALYKRFRKEFDEVLFVVSNRGTSPETRIDPELCEFTNVLCIEYEELIYSNKQDIEIMVQKLTAKFQNRFEYFFGANSSLFGQDKQVNAVRRLEDMAEATIAMSSQPFSEVHNKFGVHGGHRNRDGSEMISGVLTADKANPIPALVPTNNSADPSQRKLFYCGGWKGQTSFKYSTFGLIIGNSLFPEMKGIHLQSDGKVSAVTAIPLTEESLPTAVAEDILIMHSHQFCEIRLWRTNFPGTQLHINVEPYDLHPLHVINPTGELTYNYLPTYGNTYVIGPHKDTEKSIRVPFCSMRLWFMHISRPTEIILPKIIDPTRKPKNTKENFLIYINSHYVEHRERAAFALSNIGTIHTLGKCQGNVDVQSSIKNFDETVQCQPFEDNQRPGSIQPIPDLLASDGRGKNLELLSKYRYALVMENSNVPGYVSEKIIEAFLSGTVPIYYGSEIVFDIFNPKAFIYFDVENPDKSLTQIQFLEQNPAEYDKLLNEPILANGQETLEKYFSWDETVGGGQLKKRIRKMVGFDP